MIFVTEISSKVLTPGIEFTVFGGFFDSLCKVTFGGHDEVETEVVSFAEDYITIIVPDLPYGDYRVMIEDGSGDVTRLGFVTIGDFDSVTPYDYSRNYGNDDFEDLIEGLFPKGQLFDFENGSVWRRFILGISLSILYLWNLVRSYIKAESPFQTDNIDDWERELGLPELGITPISENERRREIYRVGFSGGGCSINFYKKILKLMNLDADIYEYLYNPEKFEDVPFGNEDNPASFIMIRFKVEIDDFDYFRAGVSVAGDRVMDFDNLQVESVFNKIKQSHIKIIFTYVAPIVNYLVTDDDKYLVTNDGRRIIAAMDYPE